METPSPPNTESRRQLQAMLLQRLASGPAQGASQGASGDQCVVIRGEGTTAPLVCIAGGGAGIPTYRRLSELLPDIPMFATQLFTGANRTTTYSSITEMATEHRCILQDRLPHGPYFLCGHSLGGTVAFELAQQLIAAGEIVQGILVIDQPGPQVRLSFHHWLYWQWVAISHLPWRMRIPFVLDGIRFRLRAARWLPAHWRSILFSRRRRPAPAPAPQEKRPTSHQYRRRMTDSSLNALRTFRAAPCSIPLYLVRARSGAPRIHADPFGGWGGIAQGGIRVFDLPGTHMQLFQEPTLQALAGIVREVVGKNTPGLRPKHQGGVSIETSP